MKAAVTLEFDRFDEIADKIPRAVAAEVEKTARGISSDIATRMAAINGPSSPGQYPAVDTGNLMNSYLAGTVPIKKDGTAWMVGTNVDYALPLEYGHKTQDGGFVAARPHLTPSAERARESFLRRMKNLERNLK